MSEEGITVKKGENFSEWYTQVIQKAELIEYTDVSGCLILRPYSFAIWENIRGYFDALIKKDGVQNAYFPLLIPEKLLCKEQEHVEGFTPEVAWVTHCGDTKLSERLAIRPTSETIMYDAYSKWVRSWRDLPLRLNQWVNVLRWEFKNPVPFLRTREFLWQEGHTAFATKKEADDEARKVLNFYGDVFEDLLAVPVIKGQKSDKEKFAGADYTLSVETLFPNGKAIQGATSHCLGQNFSKAFDIKFNDKDGNESYVFQNSWGISTRSIGVMLAIHGDDKGLILPPRVAPIQVVIIPILLKNKEKLVLDKIQVLEKKLKKFSCKIDDREEYSPGWKYNEWEMKGVPLRLEIGPKDVEKEQVVLVRRDTAEKKFIKIENVSERVGELLNEIQNNLFTKAKDYIVNNTVEIKDMKEMKKAIDQGKMVKALWCQDPKCEEMIKFETSGAKSLNVPFDARKGEKCVYCGKGNCKETLFARSY